MHYEPLARALPEGTRQEVRDAVAERIFDRFSEQRHGDLPGWLATLDELPRPPAPHARLDRAIVEVGSTGALSPEETARLEKTLRDLGPWRKGPFSVCGIHVDAEWRSDMKWQRVAPHLSSLDGRTVLDVGCGNGYYCLRTLGAGAKHVVGLEPSPLFVVQFEALRRLLPPLPAYVLPLALEELPDGVDRFDTVFSMGVLYHRRSATEHLTALANRLAPGGELVLETLTLPGDVKGVLQPERRYANMRNVWAIPSNGTLLEWVNKAGLVQPRVVDTTKTTPEEQRSTSWMPHYSLSEALAENDDTKTVEGYPAPLRSIVLARKP